MSPTRNSSRSTDRGWRRVFERFQLNDRADIVEISARQLNQVRDEGIAPDARLMAKFDSRDRLPLFLRERGYFIVPIRNGRYALIRGDGYLDLSPQLEPEDYSTRFSPVELSGRSRSESSQLSLALNCGLLEHHFRMAGLRQTFSGKRRSPAFEFHYRKLGPIQVDGVQLEIDGGYQAASDALVLEAKLGMPASFHVRQLYYPFRAISTSQPGASVTSAFVGCGDGDDVFSFWDVVFQEPSHYDSARVARMRAYRVTVLPAGPESTLIDQARFVAEPTPERERLISQANNLELLAQIPFIVRDGSTLGKEIAAAIGYVGRQGNYYRQAAVALGLIRKNRSGAFALTDLGSRFTQLTANARTEMLVGLVLQTDIVRRTLESLTPAGLGRDQIASVIRRNSGLGGSTLGRRASCLMSWLRWVGERTGLFEIRDQRIFRR